MHKESNIVSKRKLIFDDENCSHSTQPAKKQREEFLDDSSTNSSNSSDIDDDLFSLHDSSSLETFSDLEVEEQIVNISIDDI